MTLSDDEHERQRHLRRILAFFEELIGCVAGCGCWQPGWDSDVALATFARNGFQSWNPDEPAPTVAEVLESLDACCNGFTERDVDRAEDLLNTSFQDLADFQRFFAKSRDVLRRSLGSPSGP